MLVVPPMDAPVRRFEVTTSELDIMGTGPACPVVAPGGANPPVVLES